MKFYTLYGPHDGVNGGWMLAGREGMGNFNCSSIVTSICLYRRELYHIKTGSERVCECIRCVQIRLN